MSSCWPWRSRAARRREPAGLPSHLVLEDRAGRTIGAMPLYLKEHSRGEFVFDFSWANAYAQHGVDYYPKLVTAIPFTPVRGAAHAGAAAAPMRPRVAAALIRAAKDYARSEQLSSWHVLFPNEDSLAPLTQAGLIERRDCQFHWFNRGYDSFEAFLATFTAEKRKKAKRERRRVAEAGIEFDTRSGRGDGRRRCGGRCTSSMPTPSIGTDTSPTSISISSSASQQPCPSL